MFVIDYKSRIPLYRQIIDNVERLAARGLLPPDSQLPSVRALAMELSINPNTIARAYGELETRGIIYALPGRGNFIAGDSLAVRAAALGHTRGKLGVLAGEVQALGENHESWLGLCRQAWSDQETGREDTGKEAKA
jgi:GntR family transcriptional regulator